MCRRIESISYYSFQNSQTGGDPTSTATSSFQNSQTGGDTTSTGTSAFQNSLTGDDPTNTTTSSFQNSQTGSDPPSSFHGSLTFSSSNSTAVDLTSTVGLVSMNDIGLSEGDTQKTNRERAKVYCSHCETSISRSAWYLLCSKFYCHSTKKKRDLNHSLSILMIFPMNAPPRNGRIWWSSWL